MDHANPIVQRCIDEVRAWLYEQPRREEDIDRWGDAEVVTPGTKTDLQYLTALGIVQRLRRLELP